MYKSIIEIDRSVPHTMLASLLRTAEAAFDNRAGCVKNASSTPYRFTFEGGEDKFGCLELGMLALEKKKEFLSCVTSWNWVDEEEPWENCDILEQMMTPVR